MDFGRALGRQCSGQSWLGHPAAASTAQLGYGLSHIPIHYGDKARDERAAREAWGIQAETERSEVLACLY